jgi:hypothetical protein
MADTVEAEIYPCRYEPSARGVGWWQHLNGRMEWVISTGLIRIAEHFSAPVMLTHREASIYVIEEEVLIHYEDLGPDYPFGAAVEVGGYWFLHPDNRGGYALARRPTRIYAGQPTTLTVPAHEVWINLPDVQVAPRGEAEWTPPERAAEEMAALYKRKEAEDAAWAKEQAEEKEKAR